MRCLSQLCGHTEAKLRQNQKSRREENTYLLEILILEALSCHSRDPLTWCQHEEIKCFFFFVEKFKKVKK